MADLTKKQREILEQSIAQAAEADERREAVPTQRTRAFAQGVTFGFADELEARARALATGQSYEEALEEIRAKLKGYQEARPGEAFGYEMAGAVAPALAAAPFTGGTGTAAILAQRGATGAAAKTLGVAAPSSIRGALGYGAAQGALTGVGTGETAEERALGGAIGGVAGGALGGAMQAAAPYVTGVATGVVDYARRKLGGRGSKAVENEIQRLAAESGMSVDEIVQGVADGTIMAENKSLQRAVRGYYTAGGEAATRIEQVMAARPQATRQEAMGQIQQYLSDVGDPNIARAMRADEEAAKVLERRAYEPFKEQIATAEVVDELKDAVKAVPQAAAALNKIYRSKTGEKPFVSIKKGVVEFADDVTVEQAEVVRRTLSNLASREFKTGIGTVGEAIGDVEQTLRSALDVDVPALAATRETAAMTRTAREAYQEGQKVFSKSPDIVELELEDARRKGEGAVKAYRTGVMQALRNRMRTGSMKSMMSNLADPERKEGQILRTVIPEDELETVLASVARAARSQQTATSVTGGSQTAASLAEQARQGAGVSAMDVAEAISGSPMAAGRVIRDVIKQAAPNLSDAERLQVVDILISENPEVVRRALVDESGMAAFQAAVERTMKAIQAGAQRGAAVGPTLAADQFGLLR
jgi:hypothetical protein